MLLGILRAAAALAYIPARQRNRSWHRVVDADGRLFTDIVAERKLRPMTLRPR